MGSEDNGIVIISDKYTLKFLTALPEYLVEQEIMMNDVQYVACV